MFSLILFSMLAHASFKCDSLNKFKDRGFVPTETESLTQQMIRESRTQQLAIDQLAKSKKSNPYEFFMNSYAGKESTARIEKLKTLLRYDAVSYYLFDNPSFNPDVEAYDSKVELDGKSYYFLKDQIIAVLEPIKKTWVLRRLDKNCRQKEAIGFTSLDVSDESHLDYKINPQFCNLVKGKKSIAKLTDEKIEKTKAWINTSVDDTKSISLREDQIVAQCHLMSTFDGIKKGADSKNVN